MFIDFHTHIFPSQIAEKTLLGVKERARIDTFTDGTVNGLISSMKRSGIGVSSVSRITTHPDQVDAVNGWLQTKIQQKIIAMATVHPDANTGPEVIRSLKKDGFRGIKLHPDYQGFFVDDARMYPFYEEAQAEKMPILFHAGLDRGLPPPCIHRLKDCLRF